jgi:hypothetical protein
MEAPNGEVLGQAVATPRRLTLHGGCNISIPLHGRSAMPYRSSANMLMFSPNAVYSRQGAYQTVALGGYLGLKNFSGGFFYKAGLSSGAGAGFYSACVAYSSALFSLAYSFDFGKISNVMRQYSPDIHEVSIFFKVKHQPKNSYFPNRNTGRQIQNMPYFNYL